VPAPSAPAIAVRKTADAKLVSAGQKITYRFLVSNTGNVTLTDVGVDEGTFTGTGTLSPVTCPRQAASLAPGERVTCTAAYTVTQADVDSGRLTNTATATGIPRGTTHAMVSPPSAVVVPSAAEEMLKLVKTASPVDVDVDGDGVIGVGDRIDWTFLVTNTGSATLADIVVSDPTAGAVRCPRTSLAAGKSMTCTAPSHVITAADMDRGKVVNTAIATRHDDGTPFDSDESSAIVPLDPPTSPPSLPSIGAPYSLGLFVGGIALLVLGGVTMVVAGRRRQTWSDLA
jgi:uncharacterized repeat protein (TIGR01451 family)